MSSHFSDEQQQKQQAQPDDGYCLRHIKAQTLNPAPKGNKRRSFRGSEDPSSLQIIVMLLLLLLLQHLVDVGKLCAHIFYF
jgi:hypothetical protein